jgi:2-dehydropantoate 2-reductase
MPEAAWRNGHGWRGKVGKHKTSILQDIEIGRAIEINALAGAVIELGRLTHPPTSHIDSVYACVSCLPRLWARNKAS